MNGLRIGAYGRNVRIYIPASNTAVKFSARRARIYAARLQAAADAVDASLDDKQPRRIKEQQQ